LRFRPASRDILVRLRQLARLRDQDRAGAQLRIERKRSKLLGSDTLLRRKVIRSKPTLKNMATHGDHPAGGNDLAFRSRRRRRQTVT
jgi:hypothetical protein